MLSTHGQLGPTWELPKAGPRPPAAPPGAGPWRLASSPPFRKPVWITFRPVPSQALPEVWLPLCLSQGILGPWQCGGQAWPVPQQTVVKHSGCLGGGRPVYPGQGPGRGCRFLPRPLAIQLGSSLTQLSPRLHLLGPQTFMERLLCAKCCSPC